MPQLIPKHNLYQRRSVLLWLGGCSLGMISAVMGAKISKSQAETSLSLDKQFSSISPNALLQSSQVVEFKTIKLDNYGKAIAKPIAKTEIYQEDLGGGITLTMLRIPAGTFMMGSPSGEEGADPDETPQHSVKIKEFYMGQTLVTQAQYHALMGVNPSNFIGKNRPVETVSWLESQEFCKKLSAKTGKTYTLPSESQWEYACRAGTTTPFAFGETITTDIVNYNGKFTFGNAPKGVYRMTTTEVGQFPPNAFGLYDMHGNVWEWCGDSWHANYTGAPADGTCWVGSQDNPLKILRGGSWYRDPLVCRSADRFKGSADGGFNYVGLRVVHSPHA